VFGTPGKHHSVLKGMTNPDDFDISVIRQAGTVPTAHSSKTPLFEKLVGSFILVGCILLRYVHLYPSNIYIYPRSQLRIYWSYFSLSSQHVSAPSDHPQVKYNYITYISREAIAITTDPLFHNLSLIIVQIIPIYFTWIL
jgi:hypothetical protein